MPISEVEDVFKKYRVQEEKIESLLKQKNNINCENRNEHNFSRNELNLTLDEAKLRNQKLLKDLETVKGNLRSKAIFSPMELQWENVCQNYLKNPSLPVTTWHCQSPVFV